MAAIWPSINIEIENFNEEAFHSDLESSNI